MINDLINSLTQSTELHLLAALLLGFLVAINPCQIAISLSALTALANRNDPQQFLRKSVAFSLGRMTLYLSLGGILFFMFHFAEINVLSFYSDKVSGIVERFTPYFVAFVGMFFLVRALHRHHHNGSCHNSSKVIDRNKSVGPFVLGMMLAVLFCPESAVMFFGMMMPLAVVSKFGLLVIALFAIAAVIPLIAIAYICKFSIEKGLQWENRLEVVQYRINLIAAILLIILSVILFIWG